jgi:hypothetical protein
VTSDGCDYNFFNLGQNKPHIVETDTGSSHKNLFFYYIWMLPEIRQKKKARIFVVINSPFSVELADTRCAFLAPIALTKKKISKTMAEAKFSLSHSNNAAAFNDQIRCEFIPGNFKPVQTIFRYCLSTAFDE